MNRTSPSSTKAAPFTWKQRFVLFLIEWLGYLLVSLVCCTLRYEISSEAPEEVSGPFPPIPVIGSYWHRTVIPATWLFRRRGCAVMTSRSFDGEYIARIIKRFGIEPVRGSSSRGAVAALLGMNRVLSEGRTAAFTIDGPRGPRFVAKPGPVLLSRMSGVPILCFYLAVEHCWQLNSWDRLMIPRPFSRVHLRWSRMIRVPADASEEQMQEFHQQMQQSLERAREAAVAALGPSAS